MNRSRRRLVVLAHYAAVLVLAFLTVGQAVTLQVFLALAAVPAVMLFAIERLALGGLTLRHTSKLDERENALVARAYRIAHRVAMMLTAVTSAIGLVTGLGAISGVGVVPLAVTGFGLLLAFVTLPPAIVLWTAPEPLAEEPTGHRGPDGRGARFARPTPSSRFSID